MQIELLHSVYLFTFNCIILKTSTMVKGDYFLGKSFNSIGSIQCYNYPNS